MYKASWWQRFVCDVRHAHKQGVFDDVLAGVGMMVLIAVVVVGGVFFCG